MDIPEQRKFWTVEEYDAICDRIEANKHNDHHSSEETLSESFEEHLFDEYPESD